MGGRLRLHMVVFALGYASTKKEKVVVNLIESLNDLPEDAKFGESVAVDTETQGLNLHRDRLCLCQLADGKGNVYLVKFDGTDYSAPRLRALMEDENVLKLFHFARFDVACLKQYIKADTAPIYCTKIASRMVRTYTDRHGLKTIVEELTGKTISKEQQSSDWSAEKLTEAQKHYAASDVIYLHKLKTKLDVMLERRGFTKMAQACFDFLPARAQLDLAGWNDIDIFSHNS